MLYNTLPDKRITNKKVLLRADFDVSVQSNLIADDARIRNNLETINYLLKNKNKIICVAKLGRPKDRDPSLSLSIVIKQLQSYLPNNKITLVNDFTEQDKSVFERQTENEILVLENIRFYKEEKNNDINFAKKLSNLADIYVNDAFAMCHRTEASIVLVPNFLPSFAGFNLNKEIDMISKAISNPKKPVVAIIGGAKISTKISLIDRLINLADYLLIGGGLANTFICAEGFEIGKSFCQYEEVAKAKQILFNAVQKNKKIYIPVDVVTESLTNNISIKNISDLNKDDSIMDIGPETTAKWGSIISKSNTIIWNGPIGYFEKEEFKRGTDFIYYSIAENQNAISIVGGGDTLAAISKKEYIDKITHVSTGGGAMLEFIEKGTLPGIDALISSKKKFG